MQGLTVLGLAVLGLVVLGRGVLSVAAAGWVPCRPEGVFRSQLYSPGTSFLRTVTLSNFWPDARSSSSPENSKPSLMAI